MEHGNSARCPSFIDHVDVSSEEALGRLRRRAPRPLKMNVLQTGSWLPHTQGRVSAYPSRSRRSGGLGVGHAAGAQSRTRGRLGKFQEPITGTGEGPPTRLVDTI